MTINRGHGRLERRTVRAAPVPERVGFPHAEQVLVADRHVTDLAGGSGSTEVAYAATSEGLTSQAYSRQVLQTECQGSGTGLPSNVASACKAAGFAPVSAAEAQAALFWNDPGGTLQPPGHWLQIADTIAVLHLGRIVETGAVDKVLGAPTDDYTRTLLAAVPSIDRIRARAANAVVGA